MAPNVTSCTIHPDQKTIDNLPFSLQNSCRNLLANSEQLSKHLSKLMKEDEYQSHLIYSSDKNNHKSPPSPQTFNKQPNIDNNNEIPSHFISSPTRETAKTEQPQSINLFLVPFFFFFFFEIWIIEF